MGAEELGFLEVTSVFHRDYWPRKQRVDFHICLMLALDTAPWDLKIEIFDRYFDKTGANRTKSPSARRLRAKTRLDFGDGSHIISDANFVLASTGAPERKALFYMDMCNGHNAKRVLRQMELHMVAIREGAMASRYGVAQNHRVLLLFTSRSLMTAVRKRFGEIGKPAFASYFWYEFVEDAEHDVLGRWQSVEVGDGGVYNFITGQVIQVVQIGPQLLGEAPGCCVARLKSI